MRDVATAIVPSLRYEDAPAAIEWLGRVLGFESRMVIPDDAGGVRHSQLTLGRAMVMVASVRADEPGRRTATPAELGGITQSVYLVVPEVDAHHERARAAGADIVVPLADQPHGGRLYGCLDPEGHLWNFGSYDPFAPPTQEA